MLPNMPFEDNASLMPYGTFVEFISGKDDLLHISEIGWKRLETVVLIKIVMTAGLAGVQKLR